MSEQDPFGILDSVAELKDQISVLHETATAMKAVAQMAKDANSDAAGRHPVNINFWNGDRWVQVSLDPSSRYHGMVLELVREDRAALLQRHYAKFKGLAAKLPVDTIRDDKQ